MIDIWIQQLENKLYLLEEKLLVLETQISETEQLIQSKNKQIKSAEDRIIDQQRLVVLGSLVAGVLNKIENPLQLTISFTNLTHFLIDKLKREINSEQNQINSQKQANIQSILAEVEENLIVIDSQSLQATEIINTMLLHNSISDEQKINIDFHAQIDTALRIVTYNYKIKFEDFSLRVITEYDRSLKKVQLIPEDTIKIIVNLVNNACHSILQKKKRLGDGFQPTLLVKTQKLNENFFSISIRDNGEGIKQENIHTKLQWDENNQISPESRELSLFIARNLIHSNQGQMEIKTKLGFYAELTITFPL